MRIVTWCVAGVSAVGLVAGSVACRDPNTVTVTATSVETSQDDKTDTVLYTFYDKITEPMDRDVHRDDIAAWLGRPRKPRAV